MSDIWSGRPGQCVGPKENMSDRTSEFRQQRGGGKNVLLINTYPIAILPFQNLMARPLILN